MATVSVNIKPTIWESADWKRVLGDALQSIFCKVMRGGLSCDTNDVLCGLGVPVRSAQAVKQRRQTEANNLL